MRTALLCNSFGWLPSKLHFTKSCHGPKLTDVQIYNALKHCWFLSSISITKTASLTRTASADRSDCRPRRQSLTPNQPVFGLEPRRTLGLYFALTLNMNFANDIQVSGPALAFRPHDHLQDHKIWLLRSLLGDWKLIEPSFDWKLNHSNCYLAASPIHVKPMRTTQAEIFKSIWNFSEQLSTPRCQLEDKCGSYFAEPRLNLCMCFLCSRFIFNAWFYYQHWLITVYCLWLLEISFTTILLWTRRITDQNGAALREAPCSEWTSS